MTPLERLAELADVVIALADDAEGIDDALNRDTLCERARDLAEEAKRLANRGTVTVYPGGSGIFTVRAMDELWRRSHENAGDVVFRGWDDPSAPEPWPTLAREVER